MNSLGSLYKGANLNVNFGSLKLCTSTTPHSAHKNNHSPFRKSGWSGLKSELVPTWRAVLMEAEPFPFIS